MKSSGKIVSRDCARSCVATLVRQFLTDFGWDVSVHPIYSSDLAMSDYHAFLGLAGKKYPTLASWQAAVATFLPKIKHAIMVIGNRKTRYS